MSDVYVYFSDVDETMHIIVTNHNLGEFLFYMVCGLVARDSTYEAQ